MEQTERRLMIAMVGTVLALVGIGLVCTGAWLRGVVLFVVGGGLATWSLTVLYFEEEGAREGCLLLLLWRVIRAFFG